MPHTTTRVVDPQSLGALLRAARTIAGYTRAADAAFALSERSGLNITERMVTGLERGESTLTLPMALVLLDVYKPPGLMQFLAPAVDPSYHHLCPGSA